MSQILRIDYSPWASTPPTPAEKRAERERLERENKSLFCYYCGEHWTKSTNVDATWYSSCQNRFRGGQGESHPEAIL